MLAAVRYPSPDGYVRVRRDEVDAHWGTHGVEDVLEPDRPLGGARVKELRRFLYTVVVRLHEAGHLMPDNQPSAHARSATKAAVASIRLPEEVSLRDTFAPDSLDTAPPPPSATEDTGGHAHVVTTPVPVSLTPELSPSPPAPPPPSPATMSPNFDAKSRLNQLSQQRRSVGHPAYSREQAQVAHPPQFRATVRLVVNDEPKEFVGAWQTTCKAAEQSAAVNALRFLGDGV